MSERQWKRLDVIRRLERKELSQVQAAEILGLSERQVRNLRHAVRERGKKGVVHGNTGRAPAHRLSEELREAVVELARGRYAGFNDQHFTDKLVEVEKLSVSRASVQRILRGAGIGPARPRRPQRYRCRRERKPQAGLMVQWDGSRHDWLEGRGPMLTLMGAIDDATSELLPGAHFVAQECAAGYLRVLLAIAREKGLPHAIYMDRHSALKRNDDAWTLAEELRGRQDPTQVGRALEALAIEPIYALSPQAKGRVERQWGTLQDRLTSELRLAGARTIEEANRVLERYRQEHNRRFAVAARDARPAWRPVRPGTELERVCSFGYEAVVQNDNTVSVGGAVVQIPPGPSKRSHARAKVEVRQLLDGTWRIYLRDELIATRAASPLEELVARKARKRSAESRAFRKQLNALAVSLP